MNLLDLDEDCLNLIGSMVLEDNRKRGDEWKEECNWQNKCFVCEGEYDHESRGETYTICAVCNYLCCPSCCENRPDVWLDEEEIDFLKNIITSEDGSPEELKELLLSEVERWFPVHWWFLDGESMDLVFSVWDVCEFCVQNIPEKE